MLPSRLVVGYGAIVVAVVVVAASSIVLQPARVLDLVSAEENVLQNPLLAASEEQYLKMRGHPQRLLPFDT